MSLAMGESVERVTGQVRSYGVFESAHGFAAIGWTGESIGCLRLPAATADRAERALLRVHPAARPSKPPAAVATVIALVERYFSGETVDFAKAPALDLGEQPPFFARVYSHVRAIPLGETSNYGAVARALGAGPEAAREVGEAMARNPVPLIIPCHRVLAAGGRIGGFSAPGGADAKARMLALEGVRLSEPAKVRACESSATGQTAFSF